MELERNWVLQYLQDATGLMEDELPEGMVENVLGILTREEVEPNMPIDPEIRETVKKLMSIDPEMWAKTTWSVRRHIIGRLPADERADAILMSPRDNEWGRLPPSVRKLEVDTFRETMAVLAP